MLSRDDANKLLTAGEARNTHIGNRPNIDFGVDAPDKSYKQYNSDTEYEVDPRQKAEPLTEGGLRGAGAEETGDTPSPDKPAVATELELRCPGGKKPEVDLSYWKDIPADK